MLPARKSTEDIFEEEEKKRREEREAEGRLVLGTVFVRRQFVRVMEKKKEGRRRKVGSSEALMREMGAARGGRGRRGGESRVDSPYVSHMMIHYTNVT